MELKELINNFEANFGRMLSPFELEDIQKLVKEDGYSVELINEALKISVRNGKLFLNYVVGILVRMRSQGITNVEQLRVAEQLKQGSSKPVEVDNDFLEMLIAAAELWDDDEESREHQISLYREFQK
ncbi:DnaD domain protein [Streptococcus lutetiensis]|uniref:DnaD domain-containing protein n=1 Tax=Streptococcus lutetiensis TaxID=150055 RepID=UPI001BD9CA45|nr:DnaD domain protein [Streptococcus lutetiensis]MBT0947619.1 DnaD domain protein [Streptococcus lutetiensis]